MKRNHLKGLLSMLLSLVSLYAQAQEVTYIHERDIMNQFTTMETGAGVLSPAWYYNSLHKFQQPVYEANRIQKKYKAYHSQDN